MNGEPTSFMFSSSFMVVYKTDYPYAISSTEDAFVIPVKFKGQN